MLGPASLGIKLDKNIDFTLKKKKKKSDISKFYSFGSSPKVGLPLYFKGDRNVLPGG